MPSLRQHHCDFEPCDRAHYAFGLCRQHYRQRHLSGLELSPIQPNKIYTVMDICPYPGCEDQKKSRGLCKRHSYIRNSLDLSDAMIAKIFADPRCHLCGAGALPNKHLSVDHDHSHHDNPNRGCDRCVRGLLCHRCNVAIGMLNDNPELIERAARYVAEGGTYFVQIGAIIPQ